VCTYPKSALHCPCAPCCAEDGEGCPADVEGERPRGGGARPLTQHNTTHHLSYTKWACHSQPHNDSGVHATIGCLCTVILVRWTYPGLAEFSSPSPCALRPRRLAAAPAPTHMSTRQPNVPLMYSYCAMHVPLSCPPDGGAVTSGEATVGGGVTMPPLSTGVRDGGTSGDTGRASRDWGGMGEAVDLGRDRADMTPAWPATARHMTRGMLSTVWYQGRRQDRYLHCAYPRWRGS
jgi:hypothetical protein